MRDTSTTSVFDTRRANQTQHAKLRRSSSGNTVLCLLAMWVGKIAPPVTLGHMTILTNDLLRLTEAELTEDIQEGYCRERLAVW